MGCKHQPVDRGSETKILVEAPGIAVERVHCHLDMRGAALARPVDGGAEQPPSDTPAALVSTHDEIVELDHLARHGTGKRRWSARQQDGKPYNIRPALRHQHG